MKSYEINERTHASRSKWASHSDCYFIGFLCMNALFYASKVHFIIIIVKL